jgi:hypothetical protein
MDGPLAQQAAALIDAGAWHMREAEAPHKALCAAVIRAAVESAARARSNPYSSPEDIDRTVRRMIGHATDAVEAGDPRPAVWFLLFYGIPDWPLDARAFIAWLDAETAPARA